MKDEYISKNDFIIKCMRKGFDGKEVEDIDNEEYIE